MFPFLVKFLKHFNNLQTVLVAEIKDTNLNTQVTLLHAKSRANCNVCHFPPGNFTYLSMDVRCISKYCYKGKVIPTKTKINFNIKLSTFMYQDRLS